MIGFLRFMRGFFGLLTILMCFACYGFIKDLGGVLDVLNKFSAFIETGLAYTFIIYILIAISSAFLFVGLAKVIHKLHFKKYGTEHPVLSKNKWAL